MTTKFKVNEQEYVIQINYYAALNTLPDTFDIDITQLLVDDDNTNNVMRRLLVDDNLILKMMWFYMEDTTSMTFDDFLKCVQPSEVNAFREAFWTEVSNFSGPLKVKLLQQIWKEGKKYLKNQTFDSLDSELPPEE